MLPIGISAPPRNHRPWVTAGIVALCLLVFVHVVLLRDPPSVPYCSDLTESTRALARSAGTTQSFVCRYGAIPDDIVHGRSRLTLLSAVFVHAQWFHLLSNVLFCIAFAPRVEEDLGSVGFLALFVASGVVGGVVHVLVAPLLTTPTIGASGAVAGVMGAHLVLAPDARLRVLIGPVPMRLPSRFVIVLWAALQLGYTAWSLSRADYPGGTSYEVHVAGFGLGALVAVATRTIERRRPDAVPTGDGPDRR